MTAGLKACNPEAFSRCCMLPPLSPALGPGPWFWQIGLGTPGSSIWDSRLLWDLRVKRSDPTPPCNPIEYPSNTTEAAPENPSGHNSSLPVASYGGSRRPFFPLGMPLGPRPLCPVARTARPCPFKAVNGKVHKTQGFLLFRF